MYLLLSTLTRVPFPFLLSCRRQHSEPWELLKTDPERCKTVITYAAQLAKLLVALMEPFMPGFADKVAYQLNIDVPRLPSEFVIDLAAGHPLNNVVPLFRQVRPLVAVAVTVTVTVTVAVAVSAVVSGVCLGTSDCLSTTVFFNGSGCAAAFVHSSDQGG